MVPGSVASVALGSLWVRQLDRCLAQLTSRVASSCSHRWTLVYLTVKLEKRPTTSWIAGLWLFELGGFFSSTLNFISKFYFSVSLSTKWAY